MTYLITGGSGQLGYDVYNELISRYPDANIIMPSSKEMDLTDKEKVNEVILNYKPDVIFHCAAYTAVDKAEHDADKCYLVNSTGTYHVASASKSIGAKLIYVSTDYVFNGKYRYTNLPYKVDDATDPINVYGKSKFFGEVYASNNPKSFIVRTSWVFGINGNNFVKTMLRLAKERDKLSVVCDQFGSPTYTKDLSKLLVDMSETEKYGVYHASNEGYTSWYQFAKYIFEVNGIDIDVLPIVSADYKQIARRPLDTRLDKSKLVENGFELLPNWEDAVERYSKELKKDSKRLELRN